MSLLPEIIVKFPAEHAERSLQLINRGPAGLRWASGCPWGDVRQEMVVVDDEGAASPADMGPNAPLWLGAGTSGATKVIVGPDAGKFYASIAFDAGKASRPPKKLAVFVGCHQTSDEASSAITHLEHHLRQVHLMGGLQGLASDPLKYDPESHRTAEELRPSLGPCIVCNKLHCKLRCGGCGTVSYCGKECQLGHWKEHKGACKAARKARDAKKQASRDARAASRDAVARAARPTRPSGLSTPALRAQADELVTLLMDDSRSLNQRLGNFLREFDDDAMWDAGAGKLLPAIVDLLTTYDANKRGERIPDHGTFTNAWVWVSSTLLHGPVRSNGSFSGCNVARCRELLLDTDGAWDAVMVSLEGSLERMLASGQSSSQDIAKTSLRFLTGNLMCIEAVGRPIAERFALSTAPVLKRIIKRMDLPRRLAHLDPNSSVEGLVNQFAAFFDVWVEKLGSCPGYLNKFGLSREQQSRYRMMAKPSAAAMVAKGGNLSTHEYQAIMARASRR